MKPKKYYWKVVSPLFDKDTFVSVFICGKATLVYRIGEVIHHKFNNGIFCFKTRQAAREFKGCNHKILKVENVGNVVPNPMFGNLKKLEWDGQLEKTSVGGKFPDGTIAFTAIKPIQIVR